MSRSKFMFILMAIAIVFDGLGDFGVVVMAPTGSIPFYVYTGACVAMLILALHIVAQKLGLEDD